jgi:hypothetical protein
VRYRLEEAPAGLGLEATQVGKGRAPPPPREFCAAPGLRGFRGTFVDSPTTGAQLVEEFGLISGGTLHRGPRISN